MSNIKNEVQNYNKFLNERMLNDLFIMQDLKENLLK
jgi:hypothetical protein